MLSSLHAGAASRLVGRQVAKRRSRPAGCRSNRRAAIALSLFMAKSVILPAKPSDDVAQFMSRLSSGFSVGERIENGRKEYAELRKMLAKDKGKKKGYML